MTRHHVSLTVEGSTLLITLSLDPPLAETETAFVGAALGRSFTLERFSASGDTLSVSVRDAVPQEVLEAAVRRAVRASRQGEPDLLFRHDPPRLSPQDPQPVLEARGDVQPLGRGTFILTGQFLAVRNAVRARAAAIAASMGAQEVDNPPLLPVSVLRDVNYLHDFPHLVMLAGGLREDHAVRARFAQRHRRGAPFETLTCDAVEDLAPLGSVLAPTVCDCCYWMLRGRADVTDRVLTVSTPVFRNEASPERRLDRLTGFTVTDVVLIGGEEFVERGRKRLIDAMRDLVVALDLACTIETADDPFFSNEAMFKNLYQHAERLKYEVRAELFDGRTTAIGSINRHQDFFSRSYDYRDARGGRPHSACVGFGLERFAYALFCRHGPELCEWPEAVRAALGHPTGWTRSPGVEG